MKNIFHFHFHLGGRAPPVGPLRAIRLTEVDHVTGQRKVRVVGLRVASQEVGAAGAVVIVAPHDTEIVHKARTEVSRPTLHLSLGRDSVRLHLR